MAGDSGSGAKLGPFEGESFGLGIGFVSLPAAADGRLAIAGKWIPDVCATNRVDSNYGIITVGWKF